jgi:hypothetical protein
VSGESILTANNIGLNRWSIPGLVNYWHRRQVRHQSNYYLAPVITSFVCKELTPGAIWWISRSPSRNYFRNCFAATYTSLPNEKYGHPEKCSQQQENTALCYLRNYFELWTNEIRITEPPPTWVPFVRSQNNSKKSRIGELCKNAHQKTSLERYWGMYQFLLVRHYWGKSGTGQGNVTVTVHLRACWETLSINYFKLYGYSIIRS